ncbi:MAG: hypothetical protein IM610_08190, partial [Cytophagales bacterium]|nr:hypothetical protein [Cytophagales bacterium]
VLLFLLPKIEKIDTYEMQSAYYDLQDSLDVALQGRGRRQLHTYMNFEERSRYRSKMPPANSWYAVERAIPCEGENRKVELIHDEVEIDLTKTLVLNVSYVAGCFEPRGY